MTQPFLPAASTHAVKFLNDFEIHSGSKLNIDKLTKYYRGGHVSERDSHSERQSTMTFKTIDSRGTGFTSG